MVGNNSHRNLHDRVGIEVERREGTQSYGTNVKGLEQVRAHDTGCHLLQVIEEKIGGGDCPDNPGKK